MRLDLSAVLGRGQAGMDRRWRVPGPPRRTGRLRGVDESGDKEVSTEPPAVAQATPESRTPGGSRPAVSLDRLGCGELMELLGTLEAPGVGELDGEYATRLLAQPLPLLRRCTGR